MKISNLAQCKFTHILIVTFLTEVIVNQVQADIESDPCFRECSTNQSTRLICGYNFRLEHFWILSKACYACPNITDDCSRLECIPADGRQRAVAVVNRMLPGPAIRVCQGDTVVVDVKNELLAEETTIHWHGVHMRKSPWMDGVPGLTQCAIPTGSSFRYEFDTPDSGTYFWHSHVGQQRGDGIFGSLVVRKPRSSDKQSYLYDYDLPEHELLIMDWLADLSLNQFLKHHHGNGDNKPRSMLINGRGLPAGFFEHVPVNATIQDSGIHFVPLYEIRVVQGKSFRLRIISNGVLNCPLEMSIEGHTLLVISSDGYDVVPVTVGSLVIYSGERFDVVLRADQEPGSYWIKVRGLEDCDDRFTSANQVALLNYNTIPEGTLPKHSIRNWQEAAASTTGIQLNPLNMAPAEKGFMTINELRSLEDDDPEITAQENSDYQFFLTFDFNVIDNFHFHGPHIPIRAVRKEFRIFTPQMNFISNVMPTSPLLTQPETLSSVNICNETSMKVNCEEVYCECTHLLKVEFNSTVELILIDRGVIYDANHPFHLHGHAFRVVAMERLGSSTETSIVKELETQGRIERKRFRAPIKDTVTVPDGGYTVLRFRANNPGFWFLHCHITFHVEIGMGIVIQVGETNKMPRPPSNFPKCGNYIPDMRIPIPDPPNMLSVRNDSNPYYTSYIGTGKVLNIAPGDKRTQNMSNSVFIRSISISYVVIKSVSVLVFTRNILI